MKDVVGYESLFGVTEDGRLWSKRTQKFLKQTKLKTGYMTVASKIGGRKGVCICLRVHVAVAKAYIPNPDNKPFVNHKDGDKTNNHVSNLEWVTASENTRHAYDTGLMKSPKGFDNKLSKMCIEDVLYIRDNYIPYDTTFGSKALARKLCVSHRTILRIVNNERYIIEGN